MEIHEDEIIERIAECMADKESLFNGDDPVF